MTLIGICERLFQLVCFISLQKFSVQLTRQHQSSSSWCTSCCCTCKTQLSRQPRPGNSLGQTSPEAGVRFQCNPQPTSLLPGSSVTSFGWNKKEFIHRLSWHPSNRRKLHRVDTSLSGWKWPRNILLCLTCRWRNPKNVGSEWMAKSCVWASSRSGGSIWL